MGFPLCHNSEGLVGGEREMTKGNENSTQVVLACPVTKGEMVGSYHTHVKGPRYPSRRDIANLVTSGERVICTGQDETVVCLEPKPSTGPKEVLETVEEINRFTTPFSLASEDRYQEAVRKHFSVKEFPV